jgi:hypothetical protein
LEASNATDPALGTSLLLAHCYERQERTASAWALFREVASLAAKSSDVDRAHIARVRAADLDSRLSRVTIDVNPTQISTLTVTLDDTTVPAASFGLAIPVDPGKRLLRATAANHSPYEQLVDVMPGPAALHVQIPTLTPLPRRPAEESPSVSNDVPADREPESGKNLVWVSGGLGVLAVGASATLVILAKTDYDESLGNCRTETLCSPRGLELRGAAEKKANWATVSGAVGVGLLGASLGLWLFDDDDETVPEGKVSLGATPNSANLTLEHRF